MMDFNTILNNWYAKNKRSLPWRETHQPYHIWISEIILQQTQVVQGLDYYLRFITRFPSIKSLAEASEDNVLKQWQGLGYYSRARNLHKTAQIITTQYNGIFPSTYDEIVTLKGIGPYTAAAIASIAFNLPHAVVDGNVYRFLARYFGIDLPTNTALGKKTFLEKATLILDTTNPGDHNQAMMEMGALICKPTTPLCEECPFIQSCVAYATNTIAQLPVKTKRITQRDRHFNYLYINHNQSLYITKRTSNDIWKNLYELPLIETKNQTTLETMLFEINQQNWPINGDNIKLIATSRHVLSHQIIHTNFYNIELTDKEISIPKKWIETPLDELNTFAFSQLTLNFFKENKIGLCKI